MSQTNGTGSFYVAYQGVETTGAYSGPSFSFLNILPPGANANVTLTYPNGTGGTAQSPFVIRQYFPGATGATPILYTLDGSRGLSLKLTYSGTAPSSAETVRYNASSSSVDPQGLGTDQMTVSGVVQTDPFTLSDSDSLVIRGGTLLITAKLSHAGTWTAAQTPSVTASLPIGDLSIITTAGDGARPVIVSTALVDSVTLGTLSVSTSGGGPVVLTGANSYTGGTTINPGATLQVGNGGTTGSIAGNVANNGVLIFDRSDSIAFGGIISGTGSLTQAGSGALTLTGGNTYTGGTAVNQGATLIIGPGGQLGGGGTTVNPGGTLIVAPGGQLGSGGFGNTGNLVLSAPQTITGNYTQSSGALLTLNASSANGGGLMVSGSADLTNARIVFNALNGYLPFGAYTLVSAAKAGTSFAGTSVTVNLPANDIYNIIAVDPPTTESLVLLAQPAPTIYADTLMAQRRDFLSVSGDVAARMQEMRGAPGDAGGHTLSAHGLTVWAAAHGDYTHTSGAGGAQGFDSTSGGGVLGLDGRVFQSVHAGVALAVSDESINGGTGTSYRGQTGQIRLYATARQGRAFIDGEIGGSINGGTVKRSIPGSPQAQGDLDGRGIGALLRGGMRYDIAGWGVEPSLTVGAMNFAQNSIGESAAGPFDLAVSRGNLSSVYTLAAIETDHVFALRGRYALQASARLGWLHELASTNARLNASFGGPAVAFASAPVGRDAADLALQGRLLTGTALSVFARYETYVASRSDSQALEGGVQYQW